LFAGRFHTRRPVMALRDPARPASLARLQLESLRAEVESLEAQAERLAGLAPLPTPHSLATSASRADPEDGRGRRPSHALETPHEQPLHPVPQLRMPTGEKQEGWRRWVFDSSGCVKTPLALGAAALLSAALMVGLLVNAENASKDAAGGCKRCSGNETTAMAGQGAPGYSPPSGGEGANPFHGGNTPIIIAFFVVAAAFICCWLNISHFAKPASIFEDAEPSSAARPGERREGRRRPSSAPSFSSSYDAPRWSQFASDVSSDASEFMTPNDVECAPGRLPTLVASPWGRDQSRPEAGVLPGDDASSPREREGDLSVRGDCLSQGKLSAGLSSDGTQ